MQQDKQVKSPFRTNEKGAGHVTRDNRQNRDETFDDERMGKNANTKQWQRDRQRNGGAAWRSGKHSHYRSSGTAYSKNSSYGSDQPRRSERKPLKLTGKTGFEKSNSTLAQRANRFRGAGGINAAARIENTVGRDDAKYMGKEIIGGSKKLSDTDFEEMTVKGSCEKLEKGYFRLTAPPRAELVRPLLVLRRHVENLNEEWGGKRVHDYEWFCSQFKAVRQDLTVQRISNGFAVEVYESHARIALEEGDLNEYNQCQTQLKDLYGENQLDKNAVAHQNEFMAFRLIYYVFLTRIQTYAGGSLDLSRAMLSLSCDQRKDASIAHALRVRRAVAEFDYHGFFRLRKSCPTPGALHLMNALVPNVRQFALHRICKAYRPSLDVAFVLSELGFSPENYGYGVDWLKSCGCVLSSDEKKILTKESVVRESDMKIQNSLI